MLIPLVLASVPSLEIRPSFVPETAAWRGSQIVVVDEGDVLDGVVTVVEGWRGDLPVGSELNVPELAAFADPKERTYRSWDPTEPPVVVSGRRVLLFLMDGELGDLVVEMERGIVTRAGNSSAGPKFDERMKPLEIELGEEARLLYPVASFGTWRVSMAWVEGSDLYALEQLINPGAPMMVPQRGGVERIRALVQDLDGPHRRVQVALGFEEAPERAAALESCVQEATTYRAHRLDLVGALEACGDAGVIALENWAEEGPWQMAAWALRRVGTKAAAQALLRLLESEQDWWDSRPEGLSEEDLVNRAHRSFVYAHELTTMEHRVGGESVLGGLLLDIEKVLGSEAQAVTSLSGSIRRLRER